MPSEKILKEKKQFVENLSKKLEAANAGVIVSYKGIDVENDDKLRKELHKTGAEYFVVKNSMLKFAAEKVGLDFGDKLTGTTAIALSETEPIGISKIITKYAKELKDKTEFSVKIGFLDGKVIDAATVTEIGSLPTKEQLIGQLLSVLIAPIRGLAIAINEIAKKNES